MIENKFGMTKAELAALMDISAVRADCSLEDVREAAMLAGKFGCKCAVTLPYLTQDMKKFLDENDLENKVTLCGVAGFPFGGETTAQKVFGAKEMVALGCGEIDMVMNIGAFKSGRYDHVAEDIRAVKEACGDAALKVIIETGYLSDEEIPRASELVCKGGADFVKTSTGFVPARPTNLNMIKIIKQTIGDAAKIKAAGGVRGLSLLLSMKDAGACRFGLNPKAAMAIFNEFEVLK